MPVELRIQLKGEAELQAALREFTQVELQDWTAAWKAVAQVFRQIEREQFRSEGAHGGQRWELLSPDYAKWKARAFPGQPILQATGRLFASLTSRTSDTVEQIEKASLRLGTKVPYARFHQRGGRYLPRRPPVQLDPAGDDLRKLTAVFRRVAARKAAGVGFVVEGKGSSAGADRFGFGSGLERLIGLEAQGFTPLPAR